MTADRIPKPVAIETRDDTTALDDAEPTRAEILADLRQALKEALAGNVRPALEVLDEIDREFEDNDGNGFSATDLSEKSKNSQTEVSDSH